jgi:predicted amidohydrolase YtcJ
LEEGLIIAGGSDSDVTPMNPILGIHAAVNHPVLEHGVSPIDALKMFTINGAYAVFEDHFKGSIKEGKYADFVVLNEDPLKIQKEKIKEIQVLATIKEGNILYENNLRD